MKQLLLCLVLFWAAIKNSSAQDQVVLQIDTNFKQERILLPFKNIIVADARFDQTKLGCIYNYVVLGMATTKKRDVVFPDSLQTYLPRFIENFSQLNDTSSESLYILVKKFRLAENFVNSVNRTVNHYLTLNISASFFKMKDDKCTKLFAVDDIFLDYLDFDSDVKLSMQYNKYLRANLLTKMLYKIFAYKTWIVKESGPLVNTATINEAIKKRFILPIYTAQATTGLYKTFDEFKNAAPSVTNISITYKDDKVQNVLDQNGNKIVLKDYWGLSNGRKNYLFFRNEPVELLPCDKSFRILSYRTMKEVTGKATIDDKKNTGFLKNLFSGKTKEYFDLDMDSGELFMEEVYGKSKLQLADKELK